MESRYKRLTWTQWRSGFTAEEIILPTMNIDNDNMEPATDLGLALGYSSEFIQRRLNIETGAGVNAGLRINVPFLASSPLSELVWSPHKGLGIKCAESTFMDRRSSILLGAEQSNVVLSPIESITVSRKSNDSPMDEELLTSRATVHVSGEVAEGSRLSKSPGDEVGITPVGEGSPEYVRGNQGYVERTNIMDSEGKSLGVQNDVQMEELSNTKEDKISSLPGAAADVLSNKSDEFKANVVPIEPSFGNNSGGRVVGSGNQTLGREIVLASQVHPMKECEASNFPTVDLISMGKRRAEQPSIVAEESKNKMKKTDHAGVPPVEKLESTDENDLRTPIGNNTCGAASKIVSSEPTREVQNDLHKDEEALPMDNIVSVKRSPSSSRCRRKGKEKALSDGDVHGRMSEDEDSSHGSVESCNSARLFPTGKKRWSFEHLLMQSKRAKKEIQESPSASFVRKDSSFMNWISNMVKGFAKATEDKETSVNLALAQPHQAHQHTGQTLVGHEKTQDIGHSDMGFQSIFKSLYCSSTVVNESRPLNANYQTEGSKDICDIDATPIAYHEESGTFSKQFMPSREKLNESISITEVGPSTKPQALPVNSDSIQKNCKTSSAENKNLYALALGKDNEGMSSKSSLGKHKTDNSTENNGSDLPSQGKMTHTLSNRSDALGSLWITRFYPKTIGTSSHLAHYNQSAVSMKPDSHPRKDPGVSDNNRTLKARDYSTEEPLTSTDRALQNATNEVCTGLDRISGHNDENVCKLDLSLPSQRLKSSEAMASMFARRLDAIKHIMPSGVTDDAARTATTCFFCGIRGHHLRECPEIAETELEYLLRNINLRGGADESSCLCIRCFQANHWAVACPNASREPHQMECATSLSMHGSTSKLRHIEQNIKTFELLDIKESEVKSEPILKHKLNEMVTSDRVISGSTVLNRCIASGSVINESRKEQISPLSILNRPEIPTGTFDAIRRLRLSRTDILKWMNSHTSLSHLNGFFLRLRLGKWEEGLGGTGYHVACIVGSELESSSQNARDAIPVSVGSIKCLVESQYISNRDFCEDELMAWWSAALRNGSNIPSEEDLRAKVEEKKMLGF